MRNVVATALLTGLLCAAPGLAQDAKDPSFAPPAPVSEALDVTPVVTEPVARGERVWASADYILGWLRGTQLPPLVTTSVPGTPQVTAGELGEPTTAVLFGDNKVNGDARSGGRFALGMWFDTEYSLGVELGGYFLGSDSASFAAVSNDGTILARPFFEGATGAPAAILLAFPGLSDNAAINVSARSESFFSGHAHLRERFYNGPNLRLESLFGYRTLSFKDSLEVQQSQVALAAPFVVGTRIDAFDRFSSRNEFHGGEFGFMADYTQGRLSVQLLGKAAVGNVHRSVSIDGGTATSVPGLETTFAQGGLLALPTNIGTHDSDDWVVAPEATVNLGWAYSDNLRLRVGYTFLFWPQVTRAAGQVDTTVNSNLIPPAQPTTGPQNPRFEPMRSDVWVQSLNFGFELKY